MAKTEEEWQSEIDKLNDKIDGLVDSKKTILDEKKKLERQYKDVDTDEFFKLQDAYDKLETSYKELDRGTKAKEKELEKLSSDLEKKDSTLKNVYIDDGLTNALVKAGVKPEFMDAAKALHKQNAKLVEDNGEYKAMIGDVPLLDHITTWASEAGKVYIPASDNSGGGAGGNNNSGGGSNADTSKMTPDQMMRQGRSA